MSLFSLYRETLANHAIDANSFLHDPRTLLVGKSDRFWRFPTSLRGLSNACGIALLLGGFIALFLGWPVHTCTGLIFSLVHRTDSARRSPQRCPLDWVWL